MARDPDTPSAAATVREDAEAASASDVPSGGKVGRFVVLGKLGLGGMGVVLSAFDPDLDRKVALKMLLPHVFADGDEARRHTLFEAKAMARLQHPHVVTVYEVSTGEPAFVVMEHVDGANLRAWLKQRARSPAEILDTFLGAGDGLAAAHRAGIVHRDFKPENVLVDSEGRARVSDFGIASMLAQPGRGDRSGTLAYMAPEQLGGGRIDAHADQFAFCVSLWEALYGERPYVGNEQGDLLASMARGLGAAPRRRDVPAWLRAALERGLAFDPDARWPSMAELLGALRARRARPRRLALLALALLVAASAVAFILGRRGAAGGDPCEAAAAKISAHFDAQAAARHFAGRLHGDEDLSTVTAFVHRWPELRRQVCRAGGGALADRQATCLDRALGALDRLLERPPWKSYMWGEPWPDLPSLDRCVGPDPDGMPTLHAVGGMRHFLTVDYAFSPDGQRIAVDTGGVDRVQLVSAADGSVVPLPQSQAGAPIDWSERGLWFSDGRELRLVDPASGETLSRQSLPEGTSAISHDGTRALADSGAIVTLATSATAEIAGLDEPKGMAPAAWSPDDRWLAGIAYVRDGGQVRITLRIIDTRRLTFRETLMRFDHGLEGGVSLWWLDGHRLAINGRVDLDQGEGVWRATIDDEGRIGAWEMALATPPNTALLPAANAVRGRVLAMQDTIAPMLARIHQGIATPISEAIAPAAPWGLAVAPDGQRVVLNTAQGVGLVSLTDGSARELRVPGTGVVALDRAGRFLAVDGSRLTASTEGRPPEVVAEVPAGREVRCSFGGAFCVVFSREVQRGELRALRDGVLGPPVALPFTPVDAAVAPDGRVALTVDRGDDHVEIVDPQAGTITPWPVEQCNGGGAAGTPTWSMTGDRLFVVITCGIGHARVIALAPGRPVEHVFENADAIVNNMVPAPDGDLIAVVVRFETRLVVIDGL